MKRILALVLSCCAVVAFAAVPTTQYKTLPIAAQSMLSSHTPGKIQVTEFFSIGCPHCYEFEPKLEKWEKSAPSEVEFVRYPVGFGQPLWTLLAKAYYTAMALNKPELVDALFTAIHKDHQRLFTESALAGFFAKHGVDEKTFKQYFNSFSINQSVQHADAIVKAAGIMEVPTITVDGKYYVNPSMNKGFEGMLKTVTALVQQAKSARQG